MTMRNHPGDDALLDVTFGAASVETSRHVSACAECAGRIADVRAGLSMAAAAEAPEPSPLFWDAFRGRVAAAIDAPPARPRYARFLLPAVLATAATVAVVAYFPRETAVPAPTPSTWASLPAAEDTAAEGVATGPSAEEMVGCRDVAECVADLSDEESRVFAEALRAELATGKSL